MVKRKATLIGSVGPSGDQRSRILVSQDGSARREGNDRGGGRSAALKPGARVEWHTAGGRGEGPQPAAEVKRALAEPGAVPGSYRRTPLDFDRQLDRPLLARRGQRPGLPHLHGLMKRAAAGSGDPDAGLVRRPALDGRLPDLMARSGRDRLGPAGDGEALHKVWGATAGPLRHQRERICQGTAVSAASASEGSGGRWRR
ncbi:hypothetical protein NDU88_000381 [Pleurodeles waltl]|uniref:Uncharacterized protein n=1 Tax=Pleurodeles waltl TaxID=8319 RepID=A0AAV7VWQ6_PLEWA|nr:hypothetical protein NDU88_000381 [Pleurodeles waltl]